MSAAPDIPDIAARLDDELATLRRFLALLTQEQQVLQSGSADALPPLTEIKGHLAERLAQIMAQRVAALAAAGFSGDRAGMEAWIQSYPAPARSAFAARWAELLALAGQCRAEHELNGKLIALRLAQNQQALTALMSAGEKPLTYGPDGQQRVSAGSGRTLGSA